MSERQRSTPERPAADVEREAPSDRAAADPLAPSERAAAKSGPTSEQAVVERQARAANGEQAVAAHGVASDGGEKAALGGFDGVPRQVRWFVGVVLAALLVPGIIGFEAWPLTGWRLFSLARDGSQTAWVVEAVDARGDARPVDLEDLPLGYRHAEWPMAELPGASTERRQAVCEALLGAVVDAEPGTVAVNITRDRQRLVERGGEWTVTHDPETIHTCTADEGDG